MGILFLEATNVRNLSSFDIRPAPKANILIGENGSGKTSFLEAIYLLGLGRSFRTHLTKRIVSNGSQKLSVIGSVASPLGVAESVGIEKGISGDSKIRISGKSVSGAAALASLMPIQLLNSDSALLLSAGPSMRRKFIDWGVFHVEQSFFSSWSNFRDVLRQRNIALQLGQPESQISAWDNGFVSSSLAISEMRKQYVKEFSPLFFDIIQGELSISGLSIDFYQGWREEFSLGELLRRSLTKDLARGYTGQGPHRADLRIFVDGVPAQDVLSRGQQKSLAWAMKVAQGALLAKQCQKKCTYLVDDLASELDFSHSLAISSLLTSLDSQIFVTGIGLTGLGQLMELEDTKLFHVEHGFLREAVSADV